MTSTPSSSRLLGTSLKIWTSGVLHEAGRDGKWITAAQCAFGGAAERRLLGKLNSRFEGTPGRELTSLIGGFSQGLPRRDPGALTSLLRHGKGNWRRVPSAPAFSSRPAFFLPDWDDFVDAR